ncbi:hypothetical protein CMO94_02870 [Candidatus Woesearchaeota archaeon]|jgi:tetratricopeptide (TPR) repeat protein|nr:hypothetical protein [Candidatus Woesearchaeota archaeon]|tara:strand:+ start:681 stop:1721 length:1041 start_codon:yes stop_codon:yes gene_type:complete
MADLIETERPQGIITEFNTIGHIVLDIETKIGASAEDYRTLDDLIHKAKERINVEDTNDKYAAIEAMKQIGDLLLDEGYGYGQSLFHQGLKSKRLDCNHSVFIYLSIAEVMGLPIVAVTAPEHGFIRWLNEEGQGINWETTTRQIWDNMTYIDWRNIDFSSLQNGVFLRNLTRSEALAIAYNQVGIGFTQLREDEKAFDNYDQAIKLNPKFPEAYRNRGCNWFEKGNPDKAMEDLNVAIDLNPNFAVVYQLRGIIWHTKEDYETAIEEFNESIRLNPEDPDTFMNRGNSLFMLGDIDRAIRDYDKTIEIAPKYHLAYHNRGLAWRKKGNMLKADLDFAMAKRLPPS